MGDGVIQGPKDGSKGDGVYAPVGFAVFFTKDFKKVEVR